MNGQQREEIHFHIAAISGFLEAIRTSVSGETTDMLKYSSYRTFCRKYNDVVNDVAKMVSIPKTIDRFDLETIAKPGTKSIVVYKGYSDSIRTNLAILRSFLENMVGAKDDERENLKNFLKANLRRVVFDRPEGEKDIQKQVEALLVGKGMAKGVDYDRETGRTKVSIKESVPDFIFPKLELTLEIKFSDGKEKAAKIVDEINADIVSYGTKYRHIWFLVYDMGSIRDEAEYAHGIDNTANIGVIIVKH